MYIVYVYGQLRKGRRLHNALIEATFLGLYSLQKHLVTEIEGCYFIEYTNKDSDIAIGERYLVLEKTKKELDILEQGLKFTEVPNEKNMYYYII